MKNNSRRKFILTNAAILIGMAAYGDTGTSSLFRSGNGTIRLGSIVCVLRALELAHELSELAGLVLIACCDVFPEHLQQGMKYAEKNAKSYTDYHSLLDMKDIDAVIIATSLYLHHPMTVDALNIGKQIYLEKTLAYDIPQTLYLVQKVQASNRLLQIGYQYRYFIMYHKVQEVLAEGWCGDVNHFEYRYHRNNDWRRDVKDPKNVNLINWRMYREYSCGLKAEICAQQLDIVNGQLGSPPQKVYTMGSINYWKDGHETFANVRMVYEYPGGVKALVKIELTEAYNGYSIRVLGTKGTIEIQRKKACFYPEATHEKLGVVDGVSRATQKACSQGELSLILYEDKNQTSLSPTSSALVDFGNCILESNQLFSEVDRVRDVSVAVHMANQAIRQEQYQYRKPEYSS